MSSDDGSSSSSAACFWEFGALAFRYKVQVVEREGYVLIVAPSTEKGGVRVVRDNLVLASLFGGNESASYGV